LCVQDLQAMEGSELGASGMFRMMRGNWNSNLKMEAVCSFETLVSTYDVTTQKTTI
jgi:hypothetical protein